MDGGESYIQKMERLNATFIGKKLTETGYRYLFESNKDIYLDRRTYEITLDEKDSNKSDQQNKKFWATLSEICILQDGDLRDIDNTYCQILTMAGIKSITVRVKETDIPELKKEYRVVKEREHEMINHTPYVTAQLFSGLSTFSKKETAQIIDIALNYLQELKDND